MQATRSMRTATPRAPCRQCPQNTKSKNGQPASKASAWTGTTSRFTPGIWAAGQRSRPSLPTNTQTYCRDAAKRRPSEPAGFTPIRSMGLACDRRMTSPRCRPAAGGRPKFTIDACRRRHPLPVRAARRSRQSLLRRAMGCSTRSTWSPRTLAHSVPPIHRRCRADKRSPAAHG